MIDLEELEREGHEWDHGQLLRAARQMAERIRALEAELARVRAETVEMCKSGARISTEAPTVKGQAVTPFIDWSAVDAEFSGHIMPGLGDAPQCPRCGATRLDVPCVDAAVKEGGGG